MAEREGMRRRLETSKRGKSKEVKRSPEDHCKSFFLSLNYTR